MKYIISVFLLISIVSCKYVYTVFYKRYNYHPDYSDSVKLNYYSQNKIILDSLVALASSPCLNSYFQFRKVLDSVNKYDHPSPMKISQSFFDSTGNFKNASWVGYKERFSPKQEELRTAINEMITLTTRLHPPPKIKFSDIELAFLNKSIYVP